MKPEPNQAEPRTVAPRDQARSVAAEGIALLARAINHCDDPRIPYRYGDAEQDRFLELVGEIAKLVDSGRIVDLRPQRARADQTFQAFVRRAAGIA